MKYLLVDMDGTICEFHDPINNQVIMTEFPVGFFESKRPLSSIIKVIQNDYQDYTKIIFSQSPSDVATEEKKRWLSNHNIDWLQIFLSYPNNNKGQCLMNFMRGNNINPKDVTIIDDDLNVLRSCEKLGVRCLHPSYLLSEYESNIDKYK